MFLARGSCYKNHLARLHYSKHATYVMSVLRFADCDYPSGIYKVLLIIWFIILLSFDILILQFYKTVLTQLLMLMLTWTIISSIIL